jgi:hypothetical protein
MVRSVLCFVLLLRLLPLASLLLLLVLLLLLLLFHHHYQRHFPPACRRLCRFLRDTAVVAADAVAGAAVAGCRRLLLRKSFQRLKRRGRFGFYLGPDETVGFILSPDSAEHPLKGMTRRRTGC